MKPIFVHAFLIFVLTCSIIALFLAMGYFLAYSAIAEDQFIPLILPVPKTEMDVVLDKMNECEASGMATATNHKDRNEPSYGAYQWQMTSFKEAIDKFDMRPDDIEEAELMNLIFDRAFTRELTKRALEAGQSWRWKTCWSKSQ